MLVPLAALLNVVALFTPFLDLRRGFSTDSYSLPRSVELLWRKGLYVLAAIVVVFSVLFPLAKLAVLLRILTTAVPARARRAQLELLERLGKWSMLDVFLVCLMIALANDQLLVGATPRYGILCFTLAIALSMVSSGAMSAREQHGRAHAPSARQVLAVPWHHVAGQLVVCALLVAALCVPFVEIDDWLLVDRPVSIVGAVLGLWETGARPLAAIVAAFLVVAPLLGAFGRLLVLLMHRRARGTRAWSGRIAHVNRWAMLDVFALALGVFLVEGRSFVRTELSWGALLLALLLLLYWPASAWQSKRATV